MVNAVLPLRPERETMTNPVDPVSDRLTVTKDRAAHGSRLEAGFDPLFPEAEEFPRFTDSRAPVDDFAEDDVNRSETGFETESNDDDEFQCEVIEESSDGVQCWVQVAPTLRVKTVIPSEMFNIDSIAPGQRFLWNRRTGTARILQVTATPEILAEMDELEREYRENWADTPAPFEND